MLPVSQSKDRTLYARQKFFYDNLRTGCPKAPRKHRFEFAFSRFQIIEDQYALTGGQTVSLQDVRGLEGL